MLAVIGHNRKTGSDGETDTLDVHLWAVTKRICSSLCVCVYSTVLEETDVWREKKTEFKSVTKERKIWGFFFYINGSVFTVMKTCQRVLFHHKLNTNTETNSHLTD